MTSKQKPQTAGAAAQRVVTPDIAARQLALATASLSARRQRDALPGRIATRRLVLRAPIRGDVPDMVKAADNRNIAAMLSSLPSPYTRADGIAFVELISQRADERPFAITLDDRFIGVVGLSFSQDQPPEFGYWLGEPWWGRGLMTEAAKAVLDAVQQTRLFPLIRARVLQANPASRRVLEKSGFTLGGQTEEDFGNRGRQVLAHYTLEQPRWM